MKLPFILCTALVLLATGVPPALADEEQVEFKNLAAKKRKALIAFYFPIKAGAAEIDWGFFISKDGLALCEFSALFGKQRPNRIATTEGRVLQFPEILEVFPTHSTALVNFKTQTNAWIELHQMAPELGTHVAVLDYGNDDPAAIGPLLSQVSIISSEYRRNAFQTRLSIGSEIRQTGAVSASGASSGVPVINAQGAAVAIFTGTIVDYHQIIPICVATHELPPLIAASVKTGRRIPFPLADDRNPFDPVLFAPEYSDATNACARNDFLGARRHLRKLNASHPGSYPVRLMEFDMAMRSGEKTRLPGLAGALKPKADADPAEYVTYYLRLAQARGIGGDFDGAIEAAMASVKISPKSYSADRYILATAYEAKGQFEEAAKWYRAAAGASPEKIAIHEGLERVLGHLKGWDEQMEVTDRILELESLFRPH